MMYDHCPGFANFAEHYGSLFNWVKELERAAWTRRTAIPEDLQLTEEDLDFLQTCDLVKEILDGTWVL